MPRRKFINKNAPTTQTYALLYRSQDDPLLRDEDAGDRALFPVGRGQPQPSSSSSKSTTSSRALHIADLEETADLDFEHMRENEGEAAEHGIYYDDTSYDYMQHMRDLNSGGGESHFVDALPTKVKGRNKGKQAMRLEDALAQVDIHDEESSVAPSLIDGGSSVFSRTTKKRLLESQQDVPDEIAGFQPDMDPRLREVLEALEDDAYVDEKADEDVFGELGLDGVNNGELDLSEFEAEANLFGDEDDGWESDATERADVQVMESELKMPMPQAVQPPNTTTNGENISLEPGEQLDQSTAATASAEDGDWLRDFAKYKRDAAAAKKPTPAHPQAPSTAGGASALGDRAPTLYTLNGTPLRQKKRKGAQTNPTSYSMTSSSLNRGAGLELLDRRFDQVEKMYSLDEADEFGFDDESSIISGMTGASKMSSVSKMSTASFADPGALRSDFDGMVDEFLGGWNEANPGGGGGKRRGAKGKRGKNGNEVYGLRQLEEVRRELGPARIRRTVQKA
ncbi:Protein ltv1 [Knufia obscura]|uniref:Protein ltv1 n=2 Tax=Knufia TaxID=430999 RepID=A0AAN8EIW2_9EURO|nr:Protein ltv1 [Knufia obscura]KAK5950610.1 Protein ltv1 [Knufia fluminis]